MPDQETVDAFLPPFVPRQWLDPDDPVTIGAMVGPEAFTEVKYLMARAAAAARSTTIAEVADELPRGVRPRLRRPGHAATAWRTPRWSLVAMGSVARLGQRRRRRAARRRRRGRPARHQCFRPWPLRRGARRPWRGVPRAVVVNRAIAVGAGSILGQDVRLSPPPGPRWSTTSCSGWVGGRSPGPACAQLCTTCSPAGSRTRPLHFVDLDREAVRARSWPRRAGEEAIADDRRHALPDRHLRRRQPAARPGRSGRSSRAPSGQRDHLGPPGLPGLRRGARRAVRARRRRARRGRPAWSPPTRPGCLEVFSTPYPESSWQVPWLHSLFGNAPAVASGMAAALRATGRDDVRVVGQAGDGGTVDIGFGCLSGHVRAQRRRALRLLRQPGLHEHRRPALGGHPSGGPHRQHHARSGRRAGQRVRAGQEPAPDRDGARDPLRRHGDRRRPARPRGQGRERDVAARCPLPARARALPAGLGRPPPPTPSGSPGWPRRAGSSRSSRPSTARSPRVTPIRRRVPVEEYLRPQARFAHLFGGDGRPDVVAALQAARRPQHRPVRAARRDRGGRRHEATRSPSRLGPGTSRADQTGTLAHRAARLRRPWCAPCGNACPAGEDVRDVALRRRGAASRLRGRLAHDHGDQPVPGRDGPGLLPPVRDRLQPRPARRGRRHQLRRAVPRRPGPRAGLDGRGRRRRRPASGCWSSAPGRPACPRRTTWRGSATRSPSRSRRRRPAG